MKAFHVLLAGACLALLTSETRAQEAEAPLGSRIPRPVESQTAAQVESIQTTHRMAECVVVSDASEWSGVFAEIPGSSEERGLLRRLAGDAGNCLVRASKGQYSLAILGFQPAAIRGPVAEALIERHFAGRNIRRPSLAPPFSFTVAAALPDMNPRTRTALVVLEFADCVYRAAPRETAILFETEPATSEEGVAIDNLAPRLGPCLPAGLELNFNRLMLRGALAEAAYRYAATAAVSTSAGGQN